MFRLASIALMLSLAGCGDADPQPAPGERIRLWHTFNPHETEEINDLLAARQERGGVPVEPTLLPFARGQTIMRRALESGKGCPDVARIDASWVPGLAEAGLLRPAPAGGPALLPEAEPLATHEGQQWGIPQTIDGLALIYRRETLENAHVRWPPRTIGELLAAAHRLTGSGVHGLGVRVDGYWYLAFLRAWGGTIPNPATDEIDIDGPRAADALAGFAALFGEDGVAPPPPPSGNEAQDEIRRFRAGSLAVVVSGPWLVAELAGGDGLDSLAVARLPGALRGGQVFVVPRCAGSPDEGWALARELTTPAIQARWARRFGTVPTTAASLEDAGRLSQQFYQALARAEPLPRAPLIAEMFDDLNPAVAAVVAGDATAEEALAGVARAWRRLQVRHGIAPAPTAHDAHDAGPGDAQTNADVAKGNAADAGAGDAGGRR